MSDQMEDKLKSAREKLDQFMKKKMQGSEKVLDVTEPAPAGDGGEKVNENSFVVVKSESEEVVEEASEDLSESSTESLKQLSDQISRLLNQTSKEAKDEDGVKSDDKNRVVELEQRNRELAGLLEQEELARRRLSVEVEGHAVQIETLKQAHAIEKEELETQLANNVEQLNEKIVSQSKTISILVG